MNIYMQAAIKRMALAAVKNSLKKGFPESYSCDRIDQIISERLPLFEDIARVMLNALLDDK